MIYFFIFHQRKNTLSCLQCEEEWLHHLVALCVCEQTHTAVCLVQWPEWQLWGWSWSLGVEPFVVLTDGAGADSGLLQATKKKKNWGVGMNEEPRQKQNNK